MKIVIPVKENKGLKSEVYGHFGSAPMFMLVDTETRAVDALDNRDRGHVHGVCNPLKTLGGHPVDAIIVGGIGAGALHGLRNTGIRVFHSPGGTISDVISSLLGNQLAEIESQPLCGGHDPGHGCGCQ